MNRIKGKAGNNPSDHTFKTQPIQQGLCRGIQHPIQKTVERTHHRTHDAGDLLRHLSG